MVQVMLNPPKKRKKKSTRGAKKKTLKRKKKRHAPRRRCISKRALRHEKSLKHLKSMMFKPGKRVCFPKSELVRAKSLKRFKHKYAGVRYGFARRKKSGGGGMVQGVLPFGPPPKRTKAPKAARAGRPKGVKYEYMEIFNMSPLERQMRGITEKHLRIADKRGHVVVKTPKAAASAPASPEYTGEMYESPVGTNPYRRKYRFNYTVPVYAFNNELSMAGLRDGITAGYRPQVLMQVVPVVGGLVANSLLAGTLSNMVATRLNLGDTTKGPVKLGVGLLSAGLLSMATKMVAPRYAQSVFLGGLAQTLWDGYQTYLQPLVKKYTGLGCCEIGEQPDLTFGLYCPECADGLANTLNDFLTPRQVQFAQPVISGAVASVIAAENAAMQAAPLTATVNGKEVIVEKVVNQPSGASGFGDFLTPNQVAQASPLGDFGSL
jgi:hypothetical protein